MTGYAVQRKFWRRATLTNERSKNLGVEFDNVQKDTLNGCHRSCAVVYLRSLPSDGHDPASSEASQCRNIVRGWQKH